MEEEEKDNFRRVDIDEKDATRNVAKIINEDRYRVNRFD